MNTHFHARWLGIDEFEVLDVMRANAGNCTRMRGSGVQFPPPAPLQQRTAHCYLQPVWMPFIERVG